MGKLVVIEGVDGSGKSTQLRLLTERLGAEGLEFATVSFPRYSEDSSALIKMYLGGEFGTNPGDVNAYAASSFFAVDRFASYKREPWGKHYDNGGLVLTDRYTTSNAVHQGAKLPQPERAEFFRWLYDFEFRLIGLPKPDAVLYMDISADRALQRVKYRAEEQDIHEKDVEYIHSCVECSRQAAQLLGWSAIDASLDEETLHGLIISRVRAVFE